jgi:two-component system OmpR family response regulator
MSAKKMILIVDDDPHIREVVGYALESAGYDTAEARDGEEALKKFAEIDPDLIVLDILMPEMDGLEVCRRLRAESKAPILFLSSKDEEIDRIIGLELGGDDYIPKPFSPRELIARIKAVLRRTEPALDTAKSGGAEAEAKILRHGSLFLDLDRFQAFWGDSEIVLTVTELGIVRTMMGYPGKVFSRDELMRGCYPTDNIVTDRTIDSHVRRIRKKFANVGCEPIETVHGAGYKLGSCE